MPPNKKDISCNEPIVPTIRQYCNMTIQYDIDGVLVFMDISYVLKRNRMVIFTHEPIEKS